MASHSLADKTKDQKDHLDLDVALIGAGFAGTYMLWRLRSIGYNVRLIERNDRFGGVWSWNHYPGARVDSDVPTFEFTHPEIWDSPDWKWSERFPGQPEILRYFDYVQRRLDLAKDTSFNCGINSAIWDEESRTWTLKAKEGPTFKAKKIVWCTGYFTKRFVPEMPGFDDFEGTTLHTSTWPQGGIDLANKSVGIIGTGASGVQLIQEICSEVKDLYVFQRTPNTCLPMQQRRLGDGGHDKKLYPAAFAKLLTTTSGFLYAPVDKSAADDTPEEREKFFETLYAEGGFAFYLGGYNDCLTSLESNRIAYDFWRRKTWERLNDKELAKKLAPVEPLHTFGAKRPCLEQTFFESFNRDNVHLVDVREDPIARITKTGVETKSGRKVDVDVLVTATGYDAIIGGYKDIEIRGRDGRELSKDGWGNNTVYTYNGLSTSGFPNMFYVFGPQSPFANGPTACEIQSDWLIDLFEHMKRTDKTLCMSRPEADKKYKKAVNEIADTLVLGIGAGWFYGSNVPGGRCEPQIFMGGVPKYLDRIAEEKKSNYSSYILE